MQENEVPPNLGVVKHGTYPAQGCAATEIRVQVSKTRTTITVGDCQWVFELPSGKWMREG